jgi:CO dehydrogenase/acetyl-CoA synthase alpha subunit
MYADGYRDMALAQANYRDIPASQNADPCRDCDLCEINCVNGLNIAEKMNRAVELFT